MTARFVATIAAAIIGVLIGTPGFTCTTLCLFEKGRALVAYNYDAWAFDDPARTIYCRVLNRPRRTEN